MDGYLRETAKVRTRLWLASPRSGIIPSIRARVRDARKEPEAAVKMPDDDIAQVALAATDLEALVYQKILRAKGIAVLIVDQDDNPYTPSSHIGKKVEHLKILAPARQAARALEIIKDFESKKDTKSISKSGENVMFRCPHCAKYLLFPSSLRNSSQLCNHCSRIVVVPDAR